MRYRMSCMAMIRAPGWVSLFMLHALLFRPYGRVFKARVKRVLDVILGGSSSKRAWSRNFLESLSSGRRY